MRSDKNTDSRRGAKDQKHFLPGGHDLGLPQHLPYLHGGGHPYGLLGDPLKLSRGLTPENITHINQFDVKLVIFLHLLDPEPPSQE